MSFRRGYAAAAIGSMGVLLSTFPGAHAVRPDECEQQRKLYPAVWADVSREQALFDCASHYSGALRIKLGPTDRAGRAIMSLVPLRRSSETAVEDPSAGVFRIWLDKEQIARLKAGKYFATIVRREGSCWIRGSLDKDPIFLLDGRRLVLQPGAAHERIRRRCLRVQAGQVRRGKQLPIEVGGLAAELGRVLMNSDCSAIR
ncbi:MAG TPA: hypothetical protein VF913_17305 [Xanthobacteraceae bacterium]